MSARMLLSAVVLLAAPAFAKGLLVDSAQLPPQVERTLREEIAHAKLEKAATFQTVNEIRLAANTLDAKKRGGRIVPLSRGFKQLGPDALLPMLELLAFNKGSEAALTPSAELSLEVGLLEAVGALQDLRAAPVLELVLARKDVDVLVTRSAAEAFGSYQTDEAAKKLLALAKGDDTHAKAVRWGMGSCRRLAIAKALGAALLSATEVRDQVELARTVGDVGNAWAWQTPGVKTKAEEAAVRAEAARALVAAYLVRSGEARQAASNALMVVDSSQTPALISAALEKASAEQKTALAELSQRFEKNPTR